MLKIRYLSVRMFLVAQYYILMTIVLIVPFRIISVELMLVVIDWLFYVRLSYHIGCTTDSCIAWRVRGHYLLDLCISYS